MQANRNITEPRTAINVISNRSSSDTIHPIKYLQINRSFLTSNALAVKLYELSSGHFPEFYDGAHYT